MQPFVCGIAGSDLGEDDIHQGLTGSFEYDQMQLNAQPQF